MAIALRRAMLSCRTITPLLRTSRTLYHLTSHPPITLPNYAPTPTIPISPPTNFLSDFHRGFAKGRNAKFSDDDEYDGGNTIQAANIGPSIRTAALSQMEAAIEALSRELSKLRTGRASPGMLDHIIVETSGVKMPLSRIAVVSVLDSKTLSITPYDPNAVKELEKAIVSSPLGINPKLDGQRLIAAIPPLTKEHMQAVCKVVAKSSEDVKQSIRRTRQKALDTIKKSLPKKEKKVKDKNDKDKKEKEKEKQKAASSFSVDDAKKLEKEVDELTKKFIKSAEDMCKAKEKEITES
ncbi:hypothetical protein RJ640_028097 [Escallonia rubra]|uniref:Ribosome-recycling factor, chloroplastic n=1 Tax=Escallonia rubra TaxID=112253 RepID=A0AA88QI41_9ASTE|nr:hypothetical protein RJ640_028097 [Escallonia rubra]